MANFSREVVQGRQYQGDAEKIAYQVDVTNWGASPSSPSVGVLDESQNNLDVTTSVTSGSPSVSGNIITLPVIQSLVIGHLYRVEVTFIIGGSTEECYFEIQCED
jgi:hypothetical protein